MDIFAASSAGDLERVKYLLDIDSLDDDYGSSALMFAAENGHIEVIKYLLQKGANINLISKRGYAALTYAVWKGYSEIVKYLIENGADINVKSNDGDTALTYAVSKGYTEISKYLIENGADINVKSNNGSTPLNLAVSIRNLDMVNFLVQNGAKINEKDNDGDTALCLAVSKGYTEISKYLIENGSEINIKNNNGNTPLSLAINGNNYEIAEFLLERGADPFEVNCNAPVPNLRSSTGYIDNKKSCEEFLTKYKWKKMYERDMKRAQKYSQSGDIKLPKEIWEIILLNGRQQQLCQDLNSEKNKPILLFFAEEMGIPIDKNITKAQLCGVIATNLAYGKIYNEKSGKDLEAKRKEEIKLIKQTARRFGINVDRPLENILQDLSKTLL